MIDKGLIVKGIGGFYYVETPSGKAECRARGKFRKEKVSPLPGDRVEIELLEPGKGAVDKILPRKNEFVRPPIANVDLMFIVFSAVKPASNIFMIDKLTAVCEYKEIEPVILINKTDLDKAAGEYAVYSGAGFKTLRVCAREKAGVDEVKALISGKVCAFAGNSGVGKSTIVNAILGRDQMETGRLSDKIGRGRHTTRHVELIPACGGYVADTPGFGDIGEQVFDKIYAEQLQYCFREFENCLGRCQFTGCSHTKEKGCAVLQAAQEGKISRSRLQSYIQMYDEVKDIKEWQR